MAPRRRRELTDEERADIDDYINLLAQHHQERLKRELEETERTEYNGGLFSDEVKRAAWDASEGVCQRCGITVVPGVKGPDGVAYDHILPWIRGGSGSERNCQVLCTPCNRSKNDSMEDHLMGEHRAQELLRIRQHQREVLEQRRREALERRCQEPPAASDLPEPDPPYDHQRPLG
jgi:5-methylcytosine-specific restriction endonuclease McrA